TAPVMLNGIRCQLIDTAGIEELPDDAHLSSSIDATAQMVAMERLKQATIRAHCIESRTAPDEYTLSEFETGAGSRHRDIVVLTKADLTPNFASTTHEFYSVPPILTSSRTGQGLDELAASLHTLLMRNESGSSGQVVSATAERCRESVRLAENSLRLAAELVGAGAGNELVAVELRTALAELGKVVGSVYTEDLLDRIFGSFCIGK
ncbi:MAG TPA: hypothetical protein VHE81_15310, partial [Lacipirellulaceae bacterium]|nr:hypothetical protein [Lacipirellulaceae bacterium]